MTYIVGINKKEHNFITLISDIMVTRMYSDGTIARENTALKTGLLFAGCLYGLAGDANAGEAFLLKFKDSLDENKSINENVEELKKHIKNNMWEKGNGFEILFAIRNPTPDLYLFNSSNSDLVLCKQSIVTLGSGKKDLDNLVTSMNQYVDSNIMQILKENKIPIVYYPCFMCLWLSEQTLGFENTYLEKIGVGGIFHFCYQTIDKEHRHLPIMFVLISLDKSTGKVDYKIYRISFVNGFLVIDYLIENKRAAFTSRVERKDLRNYRIEEDLELLKEIYKRSDSLPFYYFCGFAAYDPNHRGYYRFHLSCNDKKVIDRNGRIDPSYLEEIIKNITLASKKS